MIQGSSSRWRAIRKNMHQVLGTKADIVRFYPLQEVEARRFVLRLIKEPKKLLKHIRKEAGAIILNISYGYNVEPEEADPLVDLADEALAQFSTAAQPGRWMVDILPFRGCSLSYCLVINVTSAFGLLPRLLIVKHVPSWFPGAGFQRVAAQYKRNLVALTEKPFAFTRKKMVRPLLTASRVSQLAKVIIILAFLLPFLTLSSPTYIIS